MTRKNREIIFDGAETVLGLSALRKVFTAIQKREGKNGSEN
jgi:hypothetical protein